MSIGSKGRKKHWCGEREFSSPIKSMVLPGKRCQLDELVQWLKDCAIKTVAMESTGVYCNEPVASPFA